jgi:hypothetical protein
MNYAIASRMEGCAYYKPTWLIACFEGDMLALLPIEYLFPLLKMLLQIFVACLANLFHYILLLCRFKKLEGFRLGV